MTIFLIITLTRQGLFELKNQYAGGFVMINAMWVAGVYMLQSHQDQLNIPWPLGVKVAASSCKQYDFQTVGITWNSGVGEDRSVIDIEVEQLELEPIGTFFMLTFIFIMAIQFIGMIQHRLMTLSHIVATTNKTFNAADPLLQNRWKSSR